MADLCNKQYITQNYMQTKDQDICQFFQEMCDEETEGRFFIEMYYCGILNQSPILVFVMMVCILLQSFYMLSQTAEEYLSPTVTYISKKINISQTLAGVTLLAIGNGCNDVVTAIIAAKGEDINFAVGSIFGAGLFVTTISLARVIKKSQFNVVRPEVKMFTRDLIFFIIAISAVILFGYIQYINLYMAIGFICIYLVYIIVTVKQEQTKKYNQQKLEEQLISSQFEMTEESIRPEQAINIIQQLNPQSEGFSKIKSLLQNGQSNDIMQQQQECQSGLGSPNNGDEIIQFELAKQESPLNSNELQQGKQQKTHLFSSKNKEHDDKLKEQIKEQQLKLNLNDYLNDEHYIQNSVEDTYIQSTKCSEIQSCNSNNNSIVASSPSLKQDVSQYSPHMNYSIETEKEFLMHEQQKKDQNVKWFNIFKAKRFLQKTIFSLNSEWKQKNILEKIVYIWKIISNAVLKLTIPPTYEDWHKPTVLLTCVLGPLFLIGSQSLIPDEVMDPWHEDWVVTPIIIVIGLLFSLYVWKTSHSNILPPYMWLFTILTFLNALSWITLIASTIISFLNFIQFLTKISKVYLGMTFLAFGNSAGDFFTNGQLSKMGYSQMAFTACFAGQLFSLIIGFGMTILIKSWNSPVSFDLFGLSKKDKWIDNLIGYSIVVVALLNMTVMLVYSILTKYTFGKPVRIWLQSFYGVVFIGASTIGLYSAIIQM